MIVMAVLKVLRNSRFENVWIPSCMFFFELKLKHLLASSCALATWSIGLLPLL